MEITNKTRRPIKVPLPEGKKLFLGPGKSAQIQAKAADHPPLKELLEAGDLELGEFSGLVDELEERAARMSSGKMHLVDLASSESFETGNDSGLGKAPSPGGDHFGLLALGKVLTALAGGRTHVPYREATLTKLLQQVPS